MTVHACPPDGTATMPCCGRTPLEATGDKITTNLANVTCKRPEPPVAKYRYTLTITGNTHAEIVSELGYQLRGGYLLDSDYEQRDEFKVWGGRKTSRLEHTNPDMTPERYDAEMEQWRKARKS